MEPCDPPACAMEVFSLCTRDHKIHTLFNKRRAIKMMKKYNQANSVKIHIVARKADVSDIILYTEKALEAIKLKNGTEQTTS